MGSGQPNRYLCGSDDRAGEARSRVVVCRLGSLESTAALASLKLRCIRHHFARTMRLLPKPHNRLIVCVIVPDASEDRTSIGRDQLLTVATSNSRIGTRNVRPLDEARTGE